MIMSAVVVTTASSSAAKPTASDMAGRSVPVASGGRLRWTAGLMAIRGWAATAGSGPTRCPTGLTFPSMAKPQFSSRAA